jgi:Pyruvate/2-oxoacid:ferredoxin oxidoreductase gamma subunit
MPPAGIIIICAFAAASYFYVAKPVAHAAKKTAHAIVHVVTLGKK